jgi:hypothetical protein
MTDGRPNGGRVAGIAAIVFATMQLVIFPAVAPDVLPVLGASPASVVSYFASHKMPFLIGNYLGVLGLVPGLVTLSYLAALFRRREGEEGWLWLLVFGSGLFAFGVGATVLVVLQAIPFLSVPGLEVGARACSDLGAIAFALMMIGVLALALSVAWATLVTRALPRWVATWGFVTAGVAFVASLGSIWTPPALAAGGPVTALALVVFACWFGALGWPLLRER